MNKRRQGKPLHPLTVFGLLAAIVLTVWIMLGPVTRLRNLLLLNAALIFCVVLMVIGARLAGRR